MGTDFLLNTEEANNSVSDILAFPKNFAVATAADTVSSFWNSGLHLLQYGGAFSESQDLKTEDILSRIDANAGAFYEEHPDLIHTSSLIAGAVVPNVIAFKLIDRARLGLKALSFAQSESRLAKLATGAIDVFSGQQETKLAKAIGEAFSKTGGAGLEYKMLKSLYYGEKALNLGIDAAAAELAVIGTMSAHPYLSDYMDDPMKNFAKGMLYGYPLFLIGGMPSRLKQLKDIEMPIEKAAILETAKLITPIRQGFSFATDFQLASTNASRLSARLSDTERPMTELAKRYMEKTLDYYVGVKMNAINEIAPWMKDAAFDDLRASLTTFLMKPESRNINRIRPVNLVMRAKATSKVLDVEGLDDILKAAADPEGVKQSVVFYRNGTFFQKENVSSAGLMVDLKAGPSARNINMYQGNAEFLVEQFERAQASALVDRSYADAILSANKIKKNEWASIALDPDDLPRLNGAISWAIKHRDQIAPDEKLFHLTRTRPTFQQVAEYIDKKTGVKAGYEEAAKRLLHGQTYDLMRSSISKEAKQALNEFVGGHLTRLRQSFDAFLHKTRITGIKYGNKPGYEVAKEIYEAGEPLRRELAKLADPEGNIYAFRGLRQEPFSSAPVESFTMNRNTARGFGDSNRVFRINVKNVIGTLGVNYLGEPEFLVTSAGHKFISEIPIGEVSRVAQTAIMKSVPFAKTTQELMAHYRESILATMDDMLTRQFSIEEISSRLNLSTQAVQARLMGGNPFELQNAIRYTSPDLMNSYLSSSNKMLALIGDLRKNELPATLQNFDNKKFFDMHMDYIDHAVKSTDSVIAKQLYSIYEDVGMIEYLDHVRGKISEVNNSALGNPLYQSMDNVLRELTGGDKPFGELITYIGKQLQTKNDEIVRELLEPVAGKFSVFKDNKVLLAEFNHAINHTLGLADYRRFVIDPDTGWGFFTTVKKADATFEELKGGITSLRDGTNFYVKQPEVIEALQSLEMPARQLFTFHNFLRQIRGMAPIQDLGYYVPPPTLVNKYYSYIIDPTGAQKTQLIVAGTADELVTKEQAIRDTLLRQNPKLQIVTQSDKEVFNLISGYQDANPYITYADVAMKHGGSIAEAIVPTDARYVDQIISGFEQQILSSGRKFNELYLYDITSNLDRLSDFYLEHYKKQPLFGSFKRLPKNTPAAVKNTLLARDNRELSTTWKMADDFTAMMLDVTTAKMNTATRGLGFSAKEKALEEFGVLNNEFTKLGISPAWKSFDDYWAARIPTSKPIAAKIVSVGNGLSAWQQLRALEVGFPLVNMLSMPILSLTSLAEKAPKFTTPWGSKVWLPFKHFSDGIQWGFSPEGKMITKTIFEPRGHIKQTVRQYNELTGMLKTVHATPDAVENVLDHVNKFLDSGFAKLLATPADMVEDMTRAQAMNIGFNAARQAYPGINNTGATIFAANFTDRAIGNYYAHQRPIIFQGVLGSAVGLYQTYMLTWAQAMYRGLENKAFLPLAFQMLSQAGIFGLKSLPFYDFYSEAIGQAYSSENVDFTTGIYRAVGNTPAEWLLYGLPSSMAFESALYTRGDVNPRIPSLANVAIVGNTQKALESMIYGVEHIAAAPTVGDKGRALLEAISLQTLNRPSARFAELAMGHSITREGRTVSTPADVWSITGVASRALSVRPMEEQVLRETNHLNSVYGAADYQARQNIVRKLRSAIRNGSLDDELISEVAHGYLMHGGSAKGWTAAMNEIMLQTPNGLRYDLLRKLEPDSPLRKMIDENF